MALGARPEQGEGIVTGDVVNTAARIQSAAPVGGVAVGEQTYRATSRVFEYEPLEPVSVKGKAEPLSLWRAKAARARFGTDITRRYTTPLVGRELEKPLLIGTFERAAQQRSVQLVTIVGEPGVGKSRLVAELFAYIEDEARADPLAAGALPAVRGGDHVLGAGRDRQGGGGDPRVRLGGGGGGEAGRGRLPGGAGAAVAAAAAGAAGRGRGGLAGGAAGAVHGLAALPRGVWPRPGRACSCSRTCTGRTRRCSRSWSIWPSGRRGCRCSSSARRGRSCTSATRAGRAGSRNATTINLSPLSDRGDGRARLLPDHHAPSSARSWSRRARAGGREPARMRRSSCACSPTAASLGAAGETELPESLQALIAARLDTLSPERKSLLQDAAVLGKVFWAGALAEIGGRDQGELELALHELARKELVRPARMSSMEGESEYSFWHLLVRDVAYGQIPRAERARRHRAAAAWIERKAGERVEDLAEVLAHHYLQALELAEAAGDTEQAEELARAGAALPRARRRAGARPRHRPGRGAARPRARALPGRRSRAAGAARPLGGRRLPGRPPARGGGRARRGARPPPRPRRDGSRRAGADPAPLARRLPPGRGPTWSRSPPRPSRCSSRSRPARRSSPPTRSSRARTSSRGAYAEAIAAADRALRARRDARPARAGARARLPRLRPRLPRRSGRPRRDGAGARPAHRAGRRPTKPPSCRTTSPSPATRSRGRPARSPTSSRGSPSASSAASPSRRRRSRPTAPACSASSAAPRRRSSAPAALAAAAEASGETCALSRLRAVELATRLARGEAEGASASPTGSIEAARTHGIADDDRRSRSRPPPPPRSPPAHPSRRARSSPSSSRRRAPASPLLRQTAGGDAADRARRRRPRPRQAARRRARATLPAPTSTPSAPPAPSSPSTPATTPTPQPSTPKRPHAGSEFGNVPERAYALLGQGRCLLALGRPGGRAAAPRGARAVRRRWATSRRSPRPRRCSSRRRPRRPRSTALYSRRSRSAFRSSRRIASIRAFELVRRVVLCVEVAARERVEAAGGELADEPRRAAPAASTARRRRSPLRHLGPHEPGADHEHLDPVRLDLLREHLAEASDGCLAGAVGRCEVEPGR